MTRLPSLLVTVLACLAWAAVATGTGYFGLAFPYGLILLLSVSGLIGFACGRLIR